MATKIEIEPHVTVGSLADVLDIPASKLITELVKNGMMVTINERIDFDTAQIIVEELELDVALTQKEQVVATKDVAHRKSSKDGETRPPVVAVMGHVDHGKTSLLDAIRQAETAAHEAGGITQHIAAYQVQHADRAITFLDTPGHEAFAALRQHGAELTDVVIIVVAADDGIKPQTLEAIRFAQKAGVKLLFAVNKIDKPGADINRVMQQISEQNMIPEAWGGDTIVVPVSAKTKEGIDKLLEMVLLIADVDDLRAPTNGPAQGIIIEAHMEQGRGPVAIALVEHGMLSPGSFVVSGSTYARVRNLESTFGKSIKQAGPSTPVVITGFKSLPEFGDAFQAVKTEKEARQRAEQQQRLQKSAQKLDIGGSELMRMINRSRSLQELNIIIKADVQGSLTSVIDSLKALNTDEVAVRIVGSGIGAINDTDVHLAHSTNAIVYGFHTSMPSAIRQIASRDKVSVRLYTIIYEMIDDVRQELTKLLQPEIVEENVGRLQVKGIFKTTKSDLICGGEVTKGKIVVPALAKIYRGSELLGDEIEVVGLKSGPSEVKEVNEGQMCGVNLKTDKKIELQLDDKIEFFTRKTVERSL
jgi:translation initiation factor IF-2